MSRKSRGPADRQRAHQPPSISLSHQEVSYSGPLPPAEEFARYEHTLPGAAQTILNMAMTQAAHRQRLEHRATTAEIIERFGSRVLAFLFALAALLVAGYCASIGQPAPAAVIGGATIASVVAAFIWSRGKDG